jgi:hypothetical protein
MSMPLSVTGARYAALGAVTLAEIGDAFIGKSSQCARRILDAACRATTSIPQRCVTVCNGLSGA